MTAVSVIALAVAVIAAVWALQRASKRGAAAARAEQQEADLEATQNQAQVAANHRADSVDDAVRELRDTGQF